jgi:hypothetical protein
LGSYEWDLQAKKACCSEEFCKIFGFLPGQFTPTYEGYLARVHAEDRSRTKAMIDRSFERCEPLTLRSVSSDRTDNPPSAQPGRMELGQSATAREADWNLPHAGQQQQRGQEFHGFAKLR